VLSALKDARRRLEEAERERTEPIAVIGVGCRFPGGADTPERYWDLLASGVDAMTEVPKDRWDLAAYYDPNPDAPGKMYAREGGFVDGIDRFDPQFFRISPREAMSLDPQQRLLLEVVWEAFEDAGQSADAIRGSDTGFFMGLSWHDYERNVIGMNPERLDAYAGMGNTQSIAVGRLAFVLGAHGPTMQVDTACSASLTAVHLACQSLRFREARMVAAGGANLMISPMSTIFCCTIRALSPESRCKTFDASADGYARGEGCGVVVLKRLSDAVADGDHIRAVIRGSAINHDGPSSGLTVPNRRAQKRVIERALENARVDPLEVSYVEAHGTGTSLGDPIEIGALGDALGKNRPPDRPLRVGSVKTNFGHLEAAAGIAGLIKVVLSLERGEIPPHLHFRDPSPNIDWDAFPVTVPTERTPWAPGTRIAGVSSFGFGGTNAHVVLEEALSLAREEARFERSYQVLCLSAKSEGALSELAERYATYLSDARDVRLSDVSFTVNAGRADFAERLAVVGASAGELAEQLGRYASGDSAAGVARGRVSGGERPKVAFLFTGQGSQWVGMGRELYDTQPVFREELERCDQILREHLERPLLEVMVQLDSDTSPLNEASYAQPALFALEWSLAQLWRSWGVEPSVLLGHSVGEYVAACQAGVFSLEDGLGLIAARGRLMERLPRDGSMVAVLCEESRVVEALAGFERAVSLAAVNGPSSLVVSGRREAVEAALEGLRTSGVETKELVVSHAFHSPLMEPMLDAFEAVVDEVKKTPPKLPVVSNVTGELAGEELATTEHWRRHVRSPVRFASGMKTLLHRGVDVFLEVGPAPVLLGMGRQCIPEEAGLWLPSLRRGHSEWKQMLNSLAQLYVRGQSIDWQGYERGYHPRRTPLPTYPFQRQRFWIEPEGYGTDGASNGTREGVRHPLLGERIHSAALRKDELQFESRVGSRSPSYLGDHRLFEKLVPPATTYLEMAFAAGALALGSDVVRLENVSVQNPLLLPEDGTRTLQCVLKPSSGGGYAFQISSFVPATIGSEASWLLHVSGSIGAPRAESVPGDASVSTFTGGDAQEIASSDCYRRFLDQGLDLGAGFRAIKRIRVRGEEAFAEIAPPDSIRSSARDHVVHPVLLDACGQAVAIAFPPEDPENVYIPVGWESIEIYRTGAVNGWAQAKLRPSDDPSSPNRTADIDLYDERGAPIARITGATTRRARREAVLRGLRLREPATYERTWRKAPWITSPADPGPNRWLVFDDSEIGTLLCSRLQERGQSCVRVQAGERFDRSGDDRYTIDPGSSADYERLYRECARDGLRGVVHIWSTADNELSLESIERGVRMGSASVLQILQTLVASTTPTPRFWIVTRGAQAVIESDMVDPAQSPLWGLGAVLSLEHPELRPVRVDLSKSSAREEIVALCDELQDGRDDQVAFRGDSRYVARLARKRRASKDERVRPFSIARDGNVLITGGLGALGLEVARWLVEQGASHLTLVGRRSPGPAAQKVIRELEATGADILLLRADVAERDDLQEVLAQLSARAPLRGVVHAAGILDDGVLLQQNGDRLRRVMAPKVTGVWNLHEATRGLSLDFFVCFSSAASLLGSRGQGNYAAANAFMDAFAHYRRRRGLPALSVNWGPWGEVGMAANMDERAKKRMYDQGWEPIPTREGMSVLGQLLADDDVQTGVLPLEWGRFLSQYPAGVTPAFFEGLAPGSSSTGEETPRARVDLVEQLRQVASIEREQLVVRHVSREVARIVGMDPANGLDSDRSFDELGIDSLMHMELRNRINEELGMNLPMAEFINRRSVRSLASLLSKQLALASVANAGDDGGDRPDMEEITL